MPETWDALAVLADPGRRALFEYIQHAGHPVSREEAADAMNISRGLAAFHLDKLVDVGLLGTRYEAPADQPRGRGRTPKVYEPTGDDISISLPEREYRLAAHILADAITDNPTDAAQAARHHAHRHGHRIGVESRAAQLDLTAALAKVGFHPQPEGDHIALTNCPFHMLAQRQTEFICGLNLEFVGGLIDGIGATRCRAHLAPQPGRCCVEIATDRSDQ